MRRICVFCGSRPGVRPAYRAAAEALGQLLAERGIELGVAARQPPLGRAAFRAATGGDPGDALAQPGERVRRLAHHLFLICSISA